MVSYNTKTETDNGVVEVSFHPDWRNSDGVQFRELGVELFKRFPPVEGWRLVEDDTLAYQVERSEGRISYIEDPAGVVGDCQEHITALMNRATELIKLWKAIQAAGALRSTI